MSQPYSLESQQVVNSAMQQANLIFIGQETHVITLFDSTRDWQIYENSGTFFWPLGDTGGTEYERGTSVIDPEVHYVAAWDDIRNWYTLVNGEIGEPANRCPEANDHVVISTPVAVFGNGRAPKINDDLDPLKPYEGKIYPAYYYTIWSGSNYENGYTLDVPNLDNIAESAGFMCPTYDPVTGERIGEEPCYQGYYRGPVLSKTEPTSIVCASATFLNNTFICVDNYNWDYLTASIQGLFNISFPCFFHGNSFISTKRSIPTSTALAYGNLSMTPQNKRSRYLNFTNELHFYDTSSIKKTKSAIHRNASSYSSFNQSGYIGQTYAGFVGGISLKGNIHYYGDRNVELSSEVGTVFFHDKTIFTGGIIKHAEFLDNSKTGIGHQTQVDGLSFYATGPNISPTGSVIFKDNSVSQWPLRCPAIFKDNSLCLSPFFNSTTFENNSVYSWELFWGHSTSPYDFFNRAIAGSEYTKPNSVATFRGDSINISSKVLTQQPTRFFDNAKIVIFKRFGDISGHLPKNYSGSFSAISNEAGNGINIASNSNHDYHWCSHAHQKTGSRVSLIVGAPANNGGPLIEGESSPEVHIVTCAPFIYAEFHDFKENGDWGDPENWTRIGGRYDLIPNVRTIVRIKSGKHVTNNSRVYASCGGLIIEDGSSINIPFNSISIIFNYGILGSTIENVNDLLMLGNSSNIGRVRQAGQTYFADQARNYKDQDDGFIRSGAVFVMAPRTINYGIDPIGGVIEVGAMPVGSSDWMNMSSTNFFSGGAVPTPETTFYNYAHQCIGKYLYQTD